MAYDKEYMQEYQSRPSVKKKRRENDNSPKRKLSRKKWKSKNRKHLKEYSKEYERKRAKNPERRKYNRDKKRKHLIKNPWIKYFRYAQDRCKSTFKHIYPLYRGKGIIVKFTPEEVKKLWFRDKAYLMEKPSIHRKDSKKNYTYDNCRFLEFSEHMKLPKGK